MKEYIAETGGRYTYADDVVNLQDLALSFSALLDGCQNFVVSGCEINGKDISAGYVYINGKIRYFQGANNVSFPYYIYERNFYETVTYANEVNKKGRCNYLCLGSQVIPEQNDIFTGLPPSYIEVNKIYTPRLIDKFFGRYSLLIDSPFNQQTVNKNLILKGNFSVDKEIESKGTISVLDNEMSYLKLSINDKSAFISFLDYDKLLNEIRIDEKGIFTFLLNGEEVAKFNKEGSLLRILEVNDFKCGSIHVEGNGITNKYDNTDDGCINVNLTGYEGKNNRYRNFNVFDGKNKNSPLFQINGKNKNVSVFSTLYVVSHGEGMILKNNQYSKDSKKLEYSIIYTDQEDSILSRMGFSGEENTDFTISCGIGNIQLKPIEFVNVDGEFQLKGKNIVNIFVGIEEYEKGLSNKVDKVSGKQLSQEDFTTTFKNKLEAITDGNISSSKDGYVKTSDVISALNKKLNVNSNLSDVEDKGKVRANLDVYSKTENDNRFLKVSGNLLELVSLSASETEGLTAEQIIKIKEEKQALIRSNIDAERKGTGDSKLAKSLNLSDLSNVSQARKNISVYSVLEVDKLLEGKLNADGVYKGEVFSTEHKDKLEGIKTGNFSGIDAEGVSITQKEGYVLISAVVKELNKKAERLLTGYNDNEKKSISDSLNFYSRNASDERYNKVDSLFQDYITFLVKQGKSTIQAQKELRDKLSAVGVDDMKNYLKTDSRLTDLNLKNSTEKKEVCTKIGAAYADDYQTKLIDTGWTQMANSGSSTDTKDLYIRQIGNVVCIQGKINTGKRDGSNSGGAVAIIPNTIPPPKYGLRTSFADFNDNAKYNRGVSFIIRANSRKVEIFESGYYNVITEMNFTYMI